MIICDNFTVKLPRTTCRGTEYYFKQPTEVLNIFLRSNLKSYSRHLSRLTANQDPWLNITRMANASDCRVS